MKPIWICYSHTHTCRDINLERLTVRACMMYNTIYVYIIIHRYLQPHFYYISQASAFVYISHVPTLSWSDVYTPLLT